MILSGFIVLLIMAALGAVPLTFFGMLFMGNIGHHIGFIDLLPGAMAVNIALGSVAAKKSD